MKPNSFLQTSVTEFARPEEVHTSSFHGITHRTKKRCKKLYIEKAHLVYTGFLVTRKHSISFMALVISRIWWCSKIRGHFFRVPTVDGRNLHDFKSGRSPKLPKLW